MKNAMDITTGYLGIFAVKKLSYEEEKIISFWTAKKNPSKITQPFKNDHHKRIKDKAVNTYLHKRCNHII